MLFPCSLEKMKEQTGEKLNKALALMYAREHRKRFYAKDIAAKVADGYAEGRIDFSFSKRNEINAHLENLESNGYVILRRVKREKSFTLYGGEFTDRMDDFCACMGIKTRDQMKREEVYTLEKCADVQNERLRAWMREEREVGTLVSPAGFSAKDAEAAIRYADHVLENDRVIYERDLSKRVMNDSKALTRDIRVLLEKILTACADEEVLSAYEERKASLGSSAQILPIYGVVKTPQYIYTQGDMTIRFRDGKTVVTQGYPYAFSSEYLNDIENIKVDSSRLITVENLTTYEDMHEEDTAKLYTGGFLSFPARQLVSRIHLDNPSLTCLHWSDIDCGGIRIFRHIRKYIPGLVPYRMDIATLRRYADYVSPLTDNDRRYLLSCKSDPVFGELAEYMLEHGYKLEQESIYA